MKKYLCLAVSAALFIAWTSLCSAQSDAPYTEGPVWQITMVKAKYGMGDDYLKGLAKTFKGPLEEAKKQDLIMDYKILVGDSANAQDFNIMLMVAIEKHGCVRQRTGEIRSHREKGRGLSRSTAVYCG